MFLLRKCLNKLKVLKGLLDNVFCKDEPSIFVLDIYQVKALFIYGFFCVSCNDLLMILG